MPFPSTNVRAVVTGAGGGLGRAFAVELGARGAKVLVSDVDRPAAEETARLVGARAHAVQCDVSKLADVEALAKDADRLLGGVDLVVNNAGVAVGGRVGEVPMADWEWIVGINMWGVVYGCHVFVPKLRAQKSGHVINVASAAGLLSPPMMGPYNVTKAAVVALSETLHAELASDGVGVTVLCPTFFRTNIGKSARGTDETLSSLVEKRMAQSKVQANDVARIALDAAQKNVLYVVPQADGQWAWRIKRMMPEKFQSMAPKAIARFTRKAGASPRG
jgi:NAD(P)-dependent dehydrogenase (short-subunit alcohol dehydrogenase family)